MDDRLARVRQQANAVLAKLSEIEFANVDSVREFTEENIKDKDDAQQWKEKLESHLIAANELAKKKDDIDSKIKMKTEKIASLREESIRLQKLADKSKEQVKKTLSNPEADISSSQAYLDSFRQASMDTQVSTLLEIVTNIDWDTRGSDESIIKGTIITETQIKPFQFDQKSNKVTDIQEQLWSMMEVDDKFAKALPRPNTVSVKK